MTNLKENRIEKLIIIWFIISFLVPITSIYYYSSDDIAVLTTLETQFCILLYVVLTYCFNCLLLFFFRGEKYKINRLKGRVTPIYKIYESSTDGFFVEKFSVHYTKLDLKWSIPFSVLFEEQEYISDGKHLFKTAPEDIAEAWEQEDNLQNCIEDSILRKKLKKQQKIDKLNKVFNENYK